MLVFDRPITTYVETNEMYSLALFLTSGQEVRTVTRGCTGKKCQQEYVAPPMLVGVALEFAEDQLIETTQRFTRRSEGWHETKNQ